VALTLAPDVAPANVSADISGTISGSQVAVGNGNLQISTGGGDCVINQAAPPRPPRARAKVSVLPRQAPALIGRDAEVALALDTVAAGEPLQLHAAAGLGKTSILRRVAHTPVAGCPDGVVYHGAARRSLDDLLQILFDLLFETDVPTKRMPGQLATDLAGWEVLFLLDDLALAEDELEALLDMVPASVFVVASPRRTLWNGEAIGLQGLAERDALALYEQRLRRPLSDDERVRCSQRSRELGGQPLQLVKDAEQLRTQAPASPPPPGPAQPSAADRLTAQMAADLPQGDRDLLALASVLGGVPLNLERLAEITGQADAGAKLARLEEQGLAQSHSPRYSSTGDAVPDGDEADGYRRRLLAYFIDYAERQRDEPNSLRDDIDPIVALLRWGAASAAPADILRLARASDTAAAHAGLWDAWQTIVDIGLASARKLGDPAGEAWALHQLGTRALCLERGPEAKGLLQSALAVRERIGDDAGAAATRHNMRFLPGGPGAPGGRGGKPGTPAGGAGSGGLPLIGSSHLIWSLPVLVVVAIGIAMMLGGPDHVAGQMTGDKHPTIPPLPPTACERGDAGCDPRPACDPLTRACGRPEACDARRDGCVRPVACTRAQGCDVPDPAVSPACAGSGSCPDSDRVDPQPQTPPPPPPPPPGPAPPPALPPAAAPANASSEVSTPADCGTIDALIAFVGKEVTFTSRITDYLRTSTLVPEQVRYVRELLAGLSCSESAISEVLTRVAASSAR
jgi:hypothetical protein